MRITIDRGGELWWLTRETPYGRNTYLRYGIKKWPVSRLCTFGYVAKSDEGPCTLRTDDGKPLLYTARFGSDPSEYVYMETREEAMDIVLHMARDHTGYLWQPAYGRRWYDYMLPFLTVDYVWEPVKC